MPTDLLSVEHLQVSYGAVQVLWDVSFSVPQGKVVCIIGSNGAGKTTTLNTVAGVLKAKGGRIVFQGEDITSHSPHERVKRHISLVPEGRHLWPNMTVEENLLMGAFPTQVRTRAMKNLERTYEMYPRLRSRRRQMAGTLSGGEQQICAIGRGLMAEPKLLMLDEPSLGLAPKMVDEIFGLVKEIAKGGVTILLVGQNVNYALQASDRGYLLETGRMTIEDSSEALLANPYVRQAYLGTSPL